MKKILSIGLLTVCALAISHREAHAWSNTKFSIGLNYHRQSAANNFLWGFYKNGQVPGPEAFSGGMPYGNVPFGGNPPGGTFPFLGSQPGVPQGYPTQTAPPPMQTSQQQAYYGMPQSYYYNPYQTVSYQPSGYYYPNYYYPTYNSYYGSYGYQAPSYWYQGR